MRLIIAVLCVGLGGCADVPVLDSQIDRAARDAPFPKLTNVALLVARANAQSTDQQAMIGDVNDRIAALTARANALRGQIIEPATRARMRRGVDSSALL